MQQGSSFDRSDIDEHFAGRGDARGHAKGNAAAAVLAREIPEPGPMRRTWPPELWIPIVGKTTHLIHRDG